ncbi:MULTISPECIES: hypothetical protein [unclassified Chryseobacterium]|uniref:hypothetical protein n=1 Tax=unclassified Chryseobacterium TaxID=2593645 RepID=UPI00103DAC19|nr:MULTISPECIES: hypothetical protein [unclassified Chryseobacterium]
MAQQASSLMIKKLYSEIKYFTKIEDLEEYILSKPEMTVYIAELDFHTDSSQGKTETPILSTPVTFRIKAW